MYSVKIISTGLALPSRTITNDDLAKVEETDDAWIRKRTGIGERRFTGDGESANQLALDAARSAFGKSGVSKEQIGLVMVATLSGNC